MTHDARSADSLQVGPAGSAGNTPLAAFDARHRAALEAGRARRRARMAHRAAKRAARHVPAATSAPTATPDGRSLGKRETVFPPPTATGAHVGALTSTFAGTDAAKNGAGNDAAERARREREADRYAGRRVLWRISRIKGVRACGRGVIDHVQGVTLKRRDGRVYASGTTRCHSIWCCPVDAAKIRAVRAADASEACVRHVQAGGTAYLVTLTAKHYRRHKLADLMDAISAAFTGLTSGAQWAGDRARGREGERARMGVVGIIRSTEVTYGRNGWHPHLHLIVLMGARQAPRPALPRKANRPEGWTPPEWDPTPTGYFPVPDPADELPAAAVGATARQMHQTQADFRRMQDRWERQWTAWLTDRGFRPSKKHGVRWDRIATVRDAEKAGEYVAKVQDGKGRTRGVGNEIARLDMKRGAVMPGADSGNRTPFELLQEYRELRALDADTAEAAGLDVPAELARIERVWREYETATKGRRAIEWSRDLRRALGMTEEEATEEEIVAADEAGDAFARLDTDTWRRVCRLGQDYAVKLAAELGGFTGLTVALAELGLEATEVHRPGPPGDEDQEAAAG